MKKTIAVLMMTVLGLTAVCAGFAETAGHPGEDAYCGVWVSEDLSTVIELGVEEDGTVVYRTPGQEHYTSWEYLPVYDKETGTLKAEHGMKSENTLSEDRTEIADSKYVYDDGKASFAIDENNTLVWVDEKEDAGKDLTFVPIGNFEGDFQCDRASISFRWNGEDYSVDVSWADSAFVQNYWQYVGSYDYQTQTVNAQGFYQKVTYKEDGSVDTEADNEEKQVEAKFYFDKDYNLIWESSDGQGKDLKFENLYTPIFELEF